MNTTENKSIAVIGAGYVGISTATFLAQSNKVTILEIDKSKIKKINNREEIIKDEEISKIFNKDLDLKATSNMEDAIVNADFAILALPTNFNNKLNKFDTSIIEEIIPKIIRLNNKINIILKSTVPIGFTSKQKKINNFENIYFSPEFLREGFALHDNFYPSRIIIGGKRSSKIISYIEILKKHIKSKNCEITFMNSSEAESVKLFSNTYLAMRVAFFNELDNFACEYGLDSMKIINGVSLDNRIGDTYNNPSFGFGGYCLPKDTKQLLTDMSEVNHDLIKAIIQSNTRRKEFIANKILQFKPKTIGIYSLAMKSNSDNFRESSIINVIEILKNSISEIYIYEPMLSCEYFLDCKVISDLDLFKKNSDLIVANRFNKDLADVASKIFSRDIFSTD